MQGRINLGAGISVGAQPSEEELVRLARDGFKSVVNLRAEREEEQPVSPREEGEKVRALGMRYLHIPVSSKAPRPEQVDQFRSEVSQLPAPVFVHCLKGKRAGAFAMIHAAIEAGWSCEDTLKSAEGLGFACDDPAMKEFVQGYIDRNRK